MFRYLILAIVVIGAIGTYLASREMTSSDTVYQMIYGFGAVISSMVHQHRYGFVDSNYGWWNYSGRLPLIPALGALSSYVSERQIVFLVLKNVVFWAVWGAAVVHLLRRFRLAPKYGFVPVILMLLAPYTLASASKVENEEGFLVALLCLLFAYLATMRTASDSVAAGLTVAAIYLTKSSMAGVCAVAVVWAGVLGWRHLRAVALIPLFCLVMAAGGWATYIHSRTGVYAFGTNTSSWNGWNFYKGNNPLAYGLYPRTMLDKLDDSPAVHRLLPVTPVHNEWELDRAQLALGNAFIRTHPGQVWRMDLKKAFVACCDLKESPEHIEGHSRGILMASHLVSHVLLAIVVVWALLDLVRRRLSRQELLFLLLGSAYLAPYAAGFLYMRHMVPLYSLAGLMLMLQVSRWAGETVPPAGV